jgi:hypothetical protein
MVGDYRKFVRPAEQVPTVGGRASPEETGRDRDDAGTCGRYIPHSIELDIARQLPLVPDGQSLRDANPAPASVDDRVEGIRVNFKRASSRAGRRFY